MVPTCRPCALNCTRRGLHSLAIGLQLGTEGSRPMVLDPWKMHRWVPTRGPGVLTHTRRGPHPGAVHTQLRTQWSPPASTGPQLRTQWSPPMGCAPSIPTKGVPTRGPRALNWAQRGPHSWAMGLQMGMEGFPPRAVRLQLRTQWSPPVGRAPSTAHEGVPTRGQRAFKHTRKDPHSRAAGPQLGTEGSAPAVRVP